MRCHVPIFHSWDLKFISLEALSSLDIVIHGGHSSERARVERVGSKGLQVSCRGQLNAAISPASGENGGSAGFSANKYKKEKKKKFLGYY